MKAAHSGVFRELVAQGLAEPADELDAALGGPARSTDQRCQGASTLEGLGVGLGGALGPAPILWPVLDVMLALQMLFIEQVSAPS